jgi:hypothetical protein
VGHVLTFKILTDDTNKVICRSRIRLSEETTNNLKLDTEAGAVPQRVYIKSKRDGNDNVILPTIDISSNPFDIDDGIPVTEKPPPVTNDDPIKNNQGESTKTDPIRNQEGESTKTDPNRNKQGESTKTDPNRNKQGEPPTETAPPIRVETVEDDEDDHSPMDDPPLSDQPDVETVDDEDNLPEHLQQPKRKPGDPNPYDETAKFILEQLRTDNPTDPSRPSPDHMKDRTFLMPPAEDGTRV